MPHSTSCRRSSTKDLTSDLRLGTFGHPWEETLCVFGELLTRVEPALTALLGPPTRRGFDR
ncbi:DUF2716 domain-containing protein [Amycolatopsis sp. NPDC048633]|uniref:DUF2716 domain-containing protein n=1 Tax=Amycolatopsis sp. NPDC048633 TaxID=3157095 RepID=UPI003406E1B5